ncbi:hypothetical protein IGI04_023610 [Brassica rapa subsp. trilocularis]|uniref:Uncharacterized protein n=1 Tax=Brassica rapa subsp. trilocularis TaxID=1813537 RepID=A0ABQ7M4C9_BRACM|nr:hypothetical protein IGI04_023610 [Brassica rapa subsp. trilocularis]
MKSRRLRGRLPDDFVWTSWKSSGLHGSLLTKSPFHNRSERFGFSDLEDFWDDLPVSSLKYNALATSRKCSRLLPLQSSVLPESRLDFLKVSSRLPGSLLTKSSSISSGVQACLCRGMIYNSFVCGLRLNFQSSQKTHFKVNCKNNLCVDRTASSEITSLAHIRFLQAHRISNETQCGEKVRDKLCLIHKNGKRRRGIDDNDNLVIT